MEDYSSHLPDPLLSFWAEDEDYSLVFPVQEQVSVTSEQPFDLWNQEYDFEELEQATASLVSSLECFAPPTTQPTPADKASPVQAGTPLPSCSTPFSYASTPSASTPGTPSSTEAQPPPVLRTEAATFKCVAPGCGRSYMFAILPIILFQ